MTAANLLLKIEQGITFSKSFTWKTGNPVLPIDLTGCTARMQIRERMGAPQALLTLTSENKGVVLGGVTGQVTLQISAKQTECLLGNTAVYSLRISFPDGTVKRLIAGAINISQDATHG